MTAISVLSEIGGDMSVFPTAKNLCSWAGCCQRNDRSGGKVKSRRISRAGSFLNPLLVQVANALIRSSKHPEFTERYRRIKARRGHKKAIIAVCKMLLTAIWNILSTRWFSCYTSCRCAIQDADNFTGSFSPAASWLYSCRRSCTSCTLNSDPVFRRLPDGLFPMPYLGLAVHTIASNFFPPV